MERLKTENLSEKEKELLESSLLSYYNMLNMGISKSKYYIKNIVDKISHNKLKLQEENKYDALAHKLLFEQNNYLDEDYLQFLLDLANNIAKNIPEDISFKTINVSNKDLIETSKNFYKSLGDSNIYDKALMILDNPQRLYILNNKIPLMYETSGININDYVFAEAYCLAVKNNNLMDYQALNHEVMHGIDFYSNKKLYSENYYGFHEVPTYMIDYLFIDYLEKQGFDKNEIQKLKEQKDNYLQKLARFTLNEIRIDMLRNKDDLKKDKSLTAQNVKKTLSNESLKQLLEIESGVISFGLYYQFKQNKDIGLSHLKKFMQSNISPNERPNFEKYGLSDEVLLSLSKEIGIYSNNVNYNIETKDTLNNKSR